MPEPFKIFFDTEFLAHGKKSDFDIKQRFGVEAVSIGLVTQNGTELYVVFNDFDESYATDWTRENVIAKLPPEEMRFSSQEVRDVIGSWLTNVVRAETDATEIEFWHRELDHDGFILRQTFGDLNSLPAFLKLIGFERVSFRDTDEIRRQTPYCQLSEQREAEMHIAINDARCEKKQYEEMIAFLLHKPQLRQHFSAAPLTPSPA